MTRVAVLYALLSAVLFGLSTPAAKVLIGTVHPAVLAGLLYCGAGIGIALLRRVLPSALSGAPEIPLGRGDLPWLAGAIGAGGIVGPLLMMVGLERTAASTASLLLTLEGAATALLAWFVFHEGFNRRVALGMVFLLAGAIALSWTGAPKLEDFLGPSAIVGACIAWGLDNNLTRKVSLADPMQIVELKGLIAGPFNLVLGLIFGAAAPSVPAALVTGLIGFVGYGLSLALFVVALRHLGAARTGAYFSTAPFIGGVAALILLGEPVSLHLLVAGLLMGFGVWLHLTERHEHEHAHEFMAHAHSHSHDEHHHHSHGPLDSPTEPHSHFHDHAPMRHSHPHMPDMHHSHRHEGWRWLSILGGRKEKRRQGDRDPR